VFLITVCSPNIRMPLFILDAAYDAWQVISSVHLARYQLFITIEADFENKCVVSFSQYVVPTMRMTLVTLNATYDTLQVRFLSSTWLRLQRLNCIVFISWTAGMKLSSLADVTTYYCLHQNIEACKFH
jgi:hypothetical protein